MWNTPFQTSDNPSQTNSPQSPVKSPICIRNLFLKHSLIKYAWYTLLTSFWEVYEQSTSDRKVDVNTSHPFPHEKIFSCRLSLMLIPYQLLKGPLFLMHRIVTVKMTVILLFDPQALPALSQGL